MRSMIYLAAMMIVTSIAAQKTEIDVDDFSELTFGTSGVLYLSQGSENKVVVDADEDVLDKIDFDQRGDRLVIRNRNNRGWNRGWGRNELKVYVTMRDISAITLSGSGPIYSETRLKTDDLEVELSGSGSMELEVESRDLEIGISGSGSIEIEGSGEDVYAKISGSGKIKADDLEVKSLDARISGSGNIYMTVEDEIEASISGSGNVYYKGNPDRVINSASGSGKIRRM